MCVQKIISLQLTRSLEEDKVRLEDEVLATVQIASKLEARLQTANSARSAAEGQAISAEARARDVCALPLLPKN